MNENNRNNKNFFAKLGHSLNLESKKYNNTLQKRFAQQDGTQPITNTADLMSTESMDEQQDGMEAGQQESQPNGMDSMPNTEAIEPNKMSNAPMNNGEGNMDMQTNDDMMEKDMPMENNQNMMNQNMNNMNNGGSMMQPEQPSSMDDGMDSDMEDDDDMDDDMNDMDMDDDMEKPDASLAATTVAKKHTAETKSMSSDQADGLLRPIDVYETKNEIIVKAIVAGVERGAIKVSITPESVTISGERQKQERISRDSYFYQELFWGSFSRSIMLPVEVDPDNAKASLKNGIFTIRLPKIEQQKERILSMDDIEEG